MVVLPLLFAALIITSMLSTFNARSGMTRIAMKSLGFKTEELEKYAENQWNLLVANKFSDKPEYVRAAQNAVLSYAQSIIRDDSELIFAVDGAGNLLSSTSELRLSAEERDRIVDYTGQFRTGWVEMPAGRKERVGYLFHFHPFDWYIFVTEERRSFYHEVREILVQNSIVLVVATLLLLGLILLLSFYLARPVERVVRAMRRMTASKNFTERVSVEYADEIGRLAHQFNIMNTDLDGAYTQVRNFALRESYARKEVSGRERETLKVLGRAAEYKYPESRIHIKRVALYARLFLKVLGHGEGEQRLIYFTAPLHDIGNLGIVDSILLKRGELTPDEFEIIKTHTQIAYDILRNTESPYLQAGARIALTHHERHDGSGYPNGLRGEEIPLFGRIVGLVDVFDSLTSWRPYREAWSFSQSLDYVLEQRGAQFDPKMVDLLESNISDIRMIFESNRED
jgi:response regulator RpfG family c-di-GMP phosphodiesterase